MPALLNGRSRGEGTVWLDEDSGDNSSPRACEGVEGGGVSAERFKIYRTHHSEPSKTAKHKNDQAS